MPLVAPLRFTPPAARAPSTAPDDPRVGHLLGRALGPGDRPHCVLVGFPVDEGVRRNGGRPGAAQGPAAIREALYRLTPDAEDAAAFIALLGHTLDLGDVVTDGFLDADQERLGDAVGEQLAAGTFVIVLGGGHETAYGHFLGYVRAGLDVALLNWDAHADVRELREGSGHSGSPFRQALLHPSGRARRYTVAGLQPHAVARAHADFVRAHGAVHFAREVDDALVRRIYAEGDDALLASFDLDAVDRAWAPGVSAPATGGLRVPTWLDAAYHAGRCARVRSADVVELNPAVDRDGQTAALAALTVWWIWKGLADRALAPPAGV